MRARYRADLALLDRSLRAAGLRARSPIRSCATRSRRVDVFGFHLASLDLRQHSGVHDRVVGELLARGGRPGYLDRDEAGRRAVLGELLAQPIAPVRDREALTAETREVLATLDVVGRARRELGRARVRALRRQLHPRGLGPARGRVPRARRGPRARRAPARCRCSSSSRISSAREQIATRRCSPHPVLRDRARRRARGHGRLLRLRQAGRLRRVGDGAAARAATRSPA